MGKENKIVHILRYGTAADKAHLETAMSAFDYLSINGNSAAYVSNAIAKFIVAKFFSNKDKGFFIDPITYAFQDKIDLLFSKSSKANNSVIKKSFSKLIDIYGLQHEKIEKSIPLLPEDFCNTLKKNEFVEKVLAFQYNLVHDHVCKQHLQKYFDYVGAVNSSKLPQLHPKFLIAPYFFMDNNSSLWEKWLELNIDFTNKSVELARKQFNNIPVFAQIVISKSFFYEPSSFLKIINAYSELQCSGYTIWIDDFNEYDSSREELSAFMSLLKSLQPKPVYNMYGGYFSILLTHKSLSLLAGVSHGLEYGESRMVYPVGGGIPVSKYYYLPLHKRLDFTKAFYLLDYADVIDTKENNWGSSDLYYEQICKCEQCKKVIGKEMINFVEFESRDFYEFRRNDRIMRRKKASYETKQNCLYHYLLCKKIEFLRVKKKKLQELIDDLCQCGKFYSKCESIASNELDYMFVWSDLCLNN